MVKKIDTFGIKLKICRKKQKNLTQEKAAKAVGCSLRAWSRWETGGAFPMAHYRVEILKLLPALKAI